MSCTLVSAFYRIPSKFPSSTYFDWGQTFLTLSSPLVFFTDAQTAPWIREKRGDRPIHLIELPFEELEMWMIYQEEWKRHHEMDPEKRIHSPELYAIWAQKSSFVERAIYLNPFQTSYFFWCDFGAFRRGSIPSEIRDHFPSSHYFLHDKLLLQSISPLQSSDWRKHDDGIRGEKLTPSWNETRLVGGLWGGSIKACLKWSWAYKSMLQEYFLCNRFAGKDQMVMLSAYLKDPGLATIVTHRPIAADPWADPWFFLEWLLSSFPVEYQEDDTYHLKNRTD